MAIKNLLKTRQQIIVLGIGYVLVAGLAFELGRINASSWEPPEIRVEEAFAPLNDTPEPPVNQSGGNPGGNPPAPAPAPAGGDCTAGQIKGNISSSGKVYHLPGGSFYNRTVAEACFNTEAEAIAAGFRKSSR